jgi:tRNA (mo5U34)-methyltransferase
MIDLYESFWSKLSEIEFEASGIEKLKKLTEDKLINPISGDFPRWYDAYENLPEISNIELCENSDAIKCIAKNLEKSVLSQVNESYKQLIPWRKGPFNMFSTYIDSEWQSFMKWQRIEKHLPDMRYKTILDVGSGNGFYMFNMLKHNPKLVMGIDPGILQIIQFWSIEKYINSGFAVLPIVMNDFPEEVTTFDMVFSMGVLYHRKSPIQHLRQLHNTLKTGGELILETLAVDGNESTCLIPTDRYAQMRNVWFLPSVSMLEIMLQRTGFTNIKCVDVSTTTITEQRTTEWMKFHSLEQFLNKDKTQTIEGYPPPTRATLIATKK